jgi:hypothetical protein
MQSKWGIIRLQRVCSVCSAFKGGETAGKSSTTIFEIQNRIRRDVSTDQVLQEGYGIDSQTT